jgi:hypothetical protein
MRSRGTTRETGTTVKTTYLSTRSRNPRSPRRKPADSGVIHFGTGSWMEADDLAPGVTGRAFTRLQLDRLTD